MPLLRPIFIPFPAAERHPASMTRSRLDLPDGRHARAVERREASADRTGSREREGAGGATRPTGGEKGPSQQPWPRAQWGLVVRWHRTTLVARSSVGLLPSSVSSVCLTMRG